MSEKTLFQKVIDHELPGNILYSDPLCNIIEDINPQAPVHLLIIPKSPIPRLSAATNEEQSLLGHLLLIAKNYAHAQGLEKSGFRLVINNGQQAGETVPHLHIHLLAGRALKWPPG